MKIVTALLFLLIPCITHSQTCNSGLGDPIVDINFGSGANFGLPLAAGITNMTYVANQCPEDGSYTIVSSTNGCYPGDWLNVEQDHTGNYQGYFMLINASFQPSVFYNEAIDGLCPSTSYQFAAWVLNMASHSGEILPNLTFRIEVPDSTVLDSLVTGGVPLSTATQWNQYAFYFTTPPGVTSVIIQIANNAPGGFGNDLALDDITFRTAGPSVNIDINGISGDTVNLCPSPGNTLQFEGTVQTCYSSTAYQWQMSTDSGSTWSNPVGATGNTYTAMPTTAGNYLYRLAAAQAGSACQVVSTPGTVVVHPFSNPAVSIAADSSFVCADSTATFMATPTNGGPSAMYQWLLNGAPVGNNGPLYSNNTLANGDQVSCMLTSDAVCPSPTTVTSNTVSLNVIPDVVSSLTIATPTNPICQDSVAIFTAQAVNGGSNPVYEWTVNGQPEYDNSPLFADSNLNNGDVVNAILTSSEQCSSPVASNVIPMTVYPIPMVALPPDTTIAPGTSAALNPTVIGQASSYQWNPANTLDNPNAQDVIATPPMTTQYTLSVTNEEGCVVSAGELVVVFYDLHMPGAFTPNGDGHNDLFIVPPVLHISVERFRVFDRWGHQVFYTTDAGTGWDGTIRGVPQPVGSYVWEIDYYDPLVKKDKSQWGTVVVIR